MKGVKHLILLVSLSSSLEYNQFVWQARGQLGGLERLHGNCRHHRLLRPGPDDGCPGARAQPRRPQQ